MYKNNKLKRKNTNDIVHFAAPFELEKVKTEELKNDGSLTKNALILVEGVFKDNKGREWEFTKDKINKIAENTNIAFNSGKRIPLCLDHIKDFSNTIGDLNGNVEVKRITYEDLPDKRNKDLIGKLGIFTKDILIKSKDAIEKINANLANTLSPGVNMAENLISEISLTPLPAIKGLSLFNQYDNNTLENNMFYYTGDAEFMNNEALTWEELEQCDQDMAELKEQYEDLSEKYFQLICNIYKADPAMLEENQVDPAELINDATEQYFMMVQELLGVMDEEQPPEASQMGYDMMSGQMYPQQQMQQQPNMQGYQQAQYSVEEMDYPEFSLLATAKKMNYNPEVLAEFAETSPKQPERFSVKNQSGIQNAWRGIKKSFKRNYLENVRNPRTGQKTFKNVTKVDPNTGNKLTKKVAATQLNRKFFKHAAIGTAGLWGLNKVRQGMFGSKPEQQPRRFGFFNEESNSTNFSVKKKV